MADPGYGANGERTDPSGLVTWEAGAPPTPFTAGFDTWLFFPLAEVELPFKDQDDDEGWTSIYPGG